MSLWNKCFVHRSVPGMLLYIKEKDFLNEEIVNNTNDYVNVSKDGRMQHETLTG